MYFNVLKYSQVSKGYRVLVALDLASRYHDHNSYNIVVEYSVLGAT